MLRSFTCSALLAVMAPAALGAEEIVESVTGEIFVYTGDVNPQPIVFKTDRPITGVAVTGGWSAVNGDFEDGLFPWSIDLTATIDAPGDEEGVWGPRIFGDTTIADFPLSDGSGPILSGNAGPGEYIFRWFDDAGQSGSLARVTDPVYHATTTVPDVTTSYDASPDPKTTWNRPFFIAGVSGLGPVAFEVFTFHVQTPGLYTFHSELVVEEDHYTFLYADAFDPAEPLEHLLDYGLGNGFSPFDEPRGTSAFSTVLFPGRTYYWVTSQWDRFSPVIDATNTIVGPGEALEGPFQPCSADLDGDGDVDLTDFGTFGACFNSVSGDANFDPACDFDGDGDIDLTDFGVFGAQFNRIDC